MENVNILDLYGNKITVTDIEAAIKQAKGGSGIDEISQRPFKLVNGISREIEDREDEYSTVGEYWSDALVKLINLKTGIKTTCVLTCNKHGFNDYDILEHETIRRACVPHGIKKGETFNVYYDESSKSGVIWGGELIESLHDATLVFNGYGVRYNALYNEFQVTHDEVGRCEEFSELSEAIEYCKKG
ncbi:hypothetical protein [Moritella sp. F3]|uniref:hypothetical protein n=1 Tax=Moritella sp. F3 TaxID=2718882 RepID=UPI0018E1AC99|nr:hypothetical protein [Moritella sp. F3]GIC77640.1 hypothetical protein FMO001_23670 [Moritella sp. F1]GIC82053.1 hypothetical protein FMO003_23340 [Moritella sp. F3]